MSEPSFDIVVFGATSFVGKILCRYLIEQYPSANDLNWAAAGRSQQKLEELKTSLGPAAAGLSLIVADATDEVALTRLCERTRIVLSTVGPYDLYGDLLVRVCAATGTDYCDLTGEPRWMRRMRETHEQEARSSGARIVHACGFDCVPSDMGTWFLQQQSRRLHGEYCTDVRMRVVAAAGGFSGGTIATLLNEAEALAADPAIARALRDPYLLCPPGYVNPARQHRVSRPEFDRELGKWVMPNIMAAVDEPVVFRTHALLDRAWGEKFRYNEAMATGRGWQGRLKATSLTGLGGLFLLAITRPSVRQLLQRHILPAPGEGPDDKAQREGFYVIRFFGQTDGGQSLQVTVRGDRDPGYGSTARIFGECGISLLRDVPADKPGGFWTPASIFDERLIERLGQRAGVSFELMADER